MLTIKHLNPNMLYIRYLPLYAWAIVVLYGGAGLMVLARSGEWFGGILSLLVALVALLSGEVQIWTLDTQRGTAHFKQLGILKSREEECPVSQIKAVGIEVRSWGPNRLYFFLESWKAIPIVTAGIPFKITEYAEEISRFLNLDASIQVI